MLYYQYQPLQHNDSIRLLVLRPSVNESDPIKCAIQHVRLSDASLEYEALSYTWGSNFQTQAIYPHNGRREILVRGNCYSALWHLRHKHEDRVLWIDAICINQDDLKERARQVCKMDQIYSCASNVVVFLREPSASRCILYEELAATEEELTQRGLVNRPQPNDAIIRELEELFQNPWFERVWILQEVCANSRVRFVCGSVSFSYRSLSELYFGFRDNAVVTRSLWPQALQWIAYPPKDFPTPQFALWNRLGLSRNCLATDPKDRVFALRSLIGPRRSAMDPVINYAQSLEECFTEVAMFLLPVLGLQLLTAGRHPHNRNMPSWIPDWSQRLPLHWLHFDVRTHLTATSPPMPGVGASDQQRHAIRPFPGTGHGIHLELLVQGCKYAKVIDQSKAFHFDSVEAAEIQIRRLYNCFIDLSQFANTEGISVDPIVSAQLGEAISEAMISIGGSRLAKHLCRGIYGPHDGPIHPAQIVDISKSLQQCKISLMENGELVIVPEAVQYGDVICLLLGSISPSALRPLPNKAWVLVSGDCYIPTIHRAQPTKSTGI